MKKSRYTEEQIAFALKKTETGTPVAEVRSMNGSYVKEPFVGFGPAYPSRPKGVRRSGIDLGV